ncbi:hypothetical protein GCM10027051_25370 [Niabella terrae]
MLFLVSCDTASTSKEAEQDSLETNEYLNPEEKDSSRIDTTLTSIGDSLKADLNAAASKIKQHSKALGAAAKTKAQEGVDAIKESAKKVEDAAKAGAEAAKKELK